MLNELWPLLEPHIHDDKFDVLSAASKAAALRVMLELLSPELSKFDVKNSGSYKYRVLHHP